MKVGYDENILRELTGVVNAQQVICADCFFARHPKRRCTRCGGGAIMSEQELYDTLKDTSAYRHALAAKERRAALDELKEALKTEKPFCYAHQFTLWRLDKLAKVFQA